MKNDNMYLNIINSMRDGVYFVDLDRRITFWNRAAEDISGYTAEEIVGRKCGDNLLSHIECSWCLQFLQNNSREPRIITY